MPTSTGFPNKTALQYLYPFKYPYLEEILEEIRLITNPIATKGLLEKPLYFNIPGFPQQTLGSGDARQTAIGFRGGDVFV